MDLKKLKELQLLPNLFNTENTLFFCEQNTCLMCWLGDLNVRATTPTEVQGINSDLGLNP